jgi:hypothetical protein
MEGNDLPEDREDLSTGSDSATDSSTSSSSSNTDSEKDYCAGTNGMDIGTDKRNGYGTDKTNKETKDGAEMNVDSLTGGTNTTGPVATSIRTPAEDAGGADTTLVAGGPLSPLNMEWLLLEEQLCGGRTLPGAGPSSANAPVIAEPQAITQVLGDPRHGLTPLGSGPDGVCTYPNAALTMTTM